MSEWVTDGQTQMVKVTYIKTKKKSGLMEGTRHEQTWQFWLEIILIEGGKKYNMKCKRKSGENLNCEWICLYKSVDYVQEWYNLLWYNSMVLYHLN